MRRAGEFECGCGCAGVARATQDYAGCGDVEGCGEVEGAGGKFGRLRGIRWRRVGDWLRRRERPEWRWCRRRLWERRSCGWGLRADRLRHRDSRRRRSQGCGRLGASGCRRVCHRVRCVANGIGRGLEPPGLARRGSGERRGSAGGETKQEGDGGNSRHDLKDGTWRGIKARENFQAAIAGPNLGEVHFFC